MFHRTSHFTALLIAWLSCASIACAEHRMLHKPLTHLRSGERREWSDFPERAAGAKLVVSFEAKANTSPSTLGLRRIDVKEAWQVVLNGKRLGRLFSDENDMDEVWELPAGALKNGENTLLVEATSERVDDVRIGQIWLDDRPKQQVFGEATLKLRAVNESGQEVPCRFTILNSNGSLSATGAESNDHLAVRSGVVYTSTGKAEIGVREGGYRVLCGRGFEYSLAEAEIQTVKGATLEATFTIQRVVDTKGLVAADTHVHTFEVSRHGDASLDERMITLAGEGIELAIATDHNIFVDYRPYLKRLKVAQHVTPIIGNEVTTKFGHFNVFPGAVGAPLPNHKLDDWSPLFKSIYGTPNVRFAIIDHPRDVHSGFTPFGPKNRISAVGRRLDNREFLANGIELINSAALQTDPMIVFHDWLTEVNRGARLTAVGSSDSHEVSRKIVGQGRSYVSVDDRDPGAIDTKAAVDSFVQGRVRVSLGLLTELTVQQQFTSGQLASKLGDSVEVSVRVQGPEWTKADRVELYANGRRIRSMEIPAAKQSAAGVKAIAKWRIEKPARDFHLVAVARGPGVTSLHWPIAKAYQPTGIDWKPYCFGSSGIVRIDSNDDGQWTSASEYARRAVNQSGGDFSALLNRLASHDAATACFAAQFWEQAKQDVSAAEVAAKLAVAPKPIRTGFQEYRRSLRESLDAAATAR